MAKYGIARYGINKYGDTGLSVYYSSGIKATSVDYKTIKVTWGGITPDPLDTAPTHWKLIKTFVGSVDNQEDGIFVDGDSLSSFRTIVYDNNFLDEQAGVQVTYSIWVYNPTTGWIFSGKADAMLVKDEASLNKITKWIPRAWLNETNSVGDAAGEPEPTNSLVKVLSAYAFEYDTLRTYTSVLSQTSNSRKAHTSLYQSLVEQFGFSYEPALGDSYHASLYKVGFLVNAYKGTTIGLKSYIAALSHLKSDIEVGHNLLLNYNDSSFEESTGRWESSQGTIERKEYTEIFTGPTPYVYNSLYPAKSKAYGSITMATSSPVTLSLPGLNDSKITYGVPVKENVRYLFTGWVTHFNNAANITVQIHWYNATGAYISSNTISDHVTTSTDWQEFTSKSDGIRDGQLSPLNAVYAAIAIIIDPSTSSSNEYAFDMLQLSEAKYSLKFEDARLIKAYLEGEQTNYILNPSFEGGVGFWTPINGTLIHNSNVSSSYLVDDAYVGQLTTSLNGISGVTSNWVELDGGSPYSFSGYVSGPAGRVARLRMEFSHRPVIPTNNLASITNITGDGSTLTVSAKNTFIVGQTVVISDVEPTNFNITGDILSANSYGFTLSSSETGSYVSGGQALVGYSSANSIESDINGEFYSNIPYYVESDPLTLTGNIQRLTVIGTPPLYDKDTGLPMAKCSLYIENAISNDVYYVDAFSLQEGETELPYFAGSGGLLPDNPITGRFFYPQDCTWERSSRINYVANSIFDNTVGWSTSSATLTAEIPSGYAPLYGTYSGKVTYSNSGSISTTVYLPFVAVGGEDVVVSAYVRGAFATYNIKTNEGGSLPTSSSFTIAGADKNQWIRIHNIRKLAAGETSFVITITVTNKVGSSDTKFFVDGVQAEFGQVPTKFINKTDNLIVRVVPNPGNTSVNMYTTEEPSISGGKSSHINNYSVKSNRLNGTLELMVPKGSSWGLIPGAPRITYPELTESIIPSASFERDLGSWINFNSTIQRVVSGGTLLGDYLTHGQAYCLVKTTHNSGDLDFSFGIYAAFIYIRPGSGYYGSVAVRPANANSLGSYSMVVTFYNADGSVHQYTPTGGSATDAIFYYVQDLQRYDRWAYFSIVAPGYTTAGASYASFEINYDAASYDPTHAFHVDRAIFRE